MMRMRTLVVAALALVAASSAGLASDSDQVERHGVGEGIASVTAMSEFEFRAGPLAYGTSPASFVNCEYCFDGATFCESDEHLLGHVDGQGPNRTYGEEEHGCEEGTCSQAHPTELCDSGPDDASLPIIDREKVWGLYVEGDLRALRSWVDSSDGVVLNVERGALQVLGCNGIVVLNLPLADSEMVSLQD
ncbi:hypothetical protein [Gaopeijia maritima]|uniref:Uncharacterized protein n=1 Tax=Gaopeijia maritima TaxID=3119007 RepID=A0ABU9E9X8_9BACT